jgi:hypothetical protein
MQIACTFLGRDHEEGNGWWRRLRSETWDGVLMRDAKTSEDVQPHTEEMELRTLASLYCQISFGPRIHRRQSEQ